MWVELALSVYPEVELFERARSEDIDRIERIVGAPLPADLRGLLLETDGMLGEYSLDVVWNARRIADDNASFRANASFADLYQPFDDLLFFGDNGGGDQFAFMPHDPQAGVIVWQHENDNRRKVAEDLSDYLRKILSSEGDEWYDE
ncbi:SMI1/KNR4 family protein [Couchioplanes azureus]|uniref:SMI1/KNR4 family protein n=1 Tax=Couchioplanes caeruleus TaxID=56438 RepID=UPI00166F93F5|nr:SMI1/KNR4 family protein [Couchioplanes caeruleus]GGQ77509.1 hypothetical protein GCM10010166_54320 [Couchioplanes caeruleus subsp. azureus]